MAYNSGNSNDWMNSFLGLDEEAAKAFGGPETLLSQPGPIQPMPFQATQTGGNESQGIMGQLIVIERMVQYIYDKLVTVESEQKEIHGKLANLETKMGSVAQGVREASSESDDEDMDEDRSESEYSEYSESSTEETSDIVGNILGLNGIL